MIRLLLGTASAALAVYAALLALLWWGQERLLFLPDRLPPEIHIFTASKQPWVILPPDTPAVPDYYDRRLVWSAESLARGKAHIARFPRR